MAVPREVDVVVEVPAGGFVKREHGQGIDYVSPIPSPFNYGCAPDLPGEDGDPIDVVLLGPRRPVGHRERARVWGVARFVDAGRPDDKLIAGAISPTEAELRRVRWFFRVYQHPRRWLNTVRGLRGTTRFLGIDRA